MSDESNGIQLLPLPDEGGTYRYPDGCSIWKSETVKKWQARWKDRVPLRGEDPRTGTETTSYFDSAEEAAKALLAGGEGPTSLPANRGLVPAPPAREAAGKHTPGPYSTNGMAADAILIEAQAPDGSPIFVASVPRTPIGDGIDRELVPVANAELFAAAPDLLAACQLFLRACRCADIHRHGFGPAFDAAQRAIAKATGSAALSAAAGGEGEGR